MYLAIIIDQFEIKSLYITIIIIILRILCMIGQKSWPNIQTQEAVGEGSFWHCKQLSFSSKLFPKSRSGCSEFSFSKQRQGNNSTRSGFSQTPLLLFPISFLKKHKPNILVPFILPGLSTIFPLSFPIAEKSYLEIQTFFWLRRVVRDVPFEVYLGLLLRRASRLFCVENSAFWPEDRGVFWGFFWRR